MRDYQRSRIYKAERYALIEGRTLETVEACQDYVDDVVLSPWWAAHFPGCTLPIVVYQAHHRLVGAAMIRQRKELQIQVAKERADRTELTLLHELAHCSDVLSTTGWHSPEFARNLLLLVRQFKGDKAHDKLAASFAKYHVNVADPISPLDQRRARKERRLYRSLIETAEELQAIQQEWRAAREALIGARR